MPAESAAAPAAEVATPNAVVAGIAASLAKGGAPAAPKTADAPPAKTPDAKTSDAALDGKSLPKDDAKKDPGGSAFAELTKRESKAVHREQAIKAKEAEFVKTQAAHEADLKELAEIRALKDKPLKLLEKFGLSYDKITEAQLAAKDDPETIVDRKLADMKKEQEKEKTAAQEAEKQQQQESYDAAIKALHDDAGEYVKGHPEECELTLLYDGGSLVAQTIQQHYAATVEFDDAGKMVKPGRMLSMSEAAKLVEAEYESMIEKVTATKKFQAKMKPPAAKAADPKAPAPKTLTNELGAGATAAAEVNAETDPIKRGIAAMKRAEERKKTASA